MCLERACLSDRVGEMEWREDYMIFFAFLLLYFGGGWGWGGAEVEPVADLLPSDSILSYQSPLEHVATGTTPVVQSVRILQQMDDFLG